MKSSILFATLLFSLMLGAQAQSAVSTSAISTSGAETAVRALVENVSQAFSAHDAKAFAATFAEDANFANWQGILARSDRR